MKVEAGLSIDNRNPFSCGNNENMNIHDDIIQLSNAWEKIMHHSSSGAKPRVAVVRYVFSIYCPYHRCCLLLIS